MGRRGAHRLTRACRCEPTEIQRTGTVYWIDADLPVPGQFPDPASFEGEQGRITRLEMQSCDADGRASQPIEPVMVPAGVPG